MEGHVVHRLVRIGLVMALALVSGPADGAAMLQPVHAASAPCTVAFGMYETNTPWDSSMSYIRNLDTQINRHSDIIHWYGQWGDAGSGIFVNNQPRMISATEAYSSVGITGSEPLITWEAWGPAPYTVAHNTFPLKSVAAGSFDSYIDTWARGLKPYGPVMLDVFHEMDGNWYPWGYGVNGNTPSDYIAAYRHVHDRFALAGATNVKFVWNPTFWNPSGVDQRIFYPGDSYVDVMAIDAYNWGAAGGSKWESLAQALSDQQIYNKLVSLNASKPIILAEWASDEPTASDPAGVTKGQWIVDAGAAMASQFPRITAAVWFSSTGTSLAINSSANSVAGAKAAFGGCNGPSPPPVPSPVPSPPVPSPVASPIPTLGPSPTPHPSPSPSAHSSPGPSPTPTRASSPTPGQSAKPKPSASPKPRPTARTSPTPLRNPAAVDAKDPPSPSNLSGPWLIAWIVAIGVSALLLAVAWVRRRSGGY